MIEISKVRGTDGDKMIKFAFVELKIFKTGSCDDSSKRMADKADLVFFNFDSIQEIFDLDS